MRQLLAALSGSDIEALVTLALDSGARQGELLALGVDDVDLDKGMIHIGRSVRRIAGQGMVFSSTKTKQSRRSVLIAAHTIAALRAYKAHQRERRLRAGELWDAKENLFFTNETDGPLDGVAVTKAFKKLVAQAGLGDLRFHDLRHSSISLLLAAGARMDEIRTRAGHSSITTTVNDPGTSSTVFGGMVSKWLASPKRAPST